MNKYFEEIEKIRKYYKNIYYENIKNEVKDIKKNKSIVKKFMLLENKKNIIPDAKINDFQNIINFVDDANKDIYEKQWGKIPIFHKMEKVKEFLEITNLDDEEKKEKLTEIKDMIVNKELKNKDIEYKNSKIYKMKNVDLDDYELEDDDISEEKNHATREEDNEE